MNFTSAKIRLDNFLAESQNIELTIKSLIELKKSIQPGDMYDPEKERKIKTKKESLAKSIKYAIFDLNDLQTLI